MPETSVQRLAQKMTPEAELLFATARVRMTAEFADRIRTVVQREVDWIDLVRLAMQHETTALLYWNLQRICPKSVPEGILAPLAARYQAQAAEAGRRAEELVRILGALEEQGIFAIAYKGPVLAQRLYGGLSLREFSELSDLDIMIHECDLENAAAVILRHGYRKHARTKRELIFCRERGGARTLELHWRFMSPSTRVQDDPERFLQRFEAVRLSGATVPSLPLEVYFLVLSLHATKHKWRKLKLICDIAEILGSHDVDWEYVVREAEGLGLKRMLRVGVLLAEDPLGAVSPPRLIRRLKADSMARTLAAECREGLLREPDKNWKKEAEFEFLFKIRERLYDKTNMFLGALAPKDCDRDFVPLPESLSRLYYIIRPVRLAWERITHRP